MPRLPVPHSSLPNLPASLRRHSPAGISAIYSFSFPSRIPERHIFLSLSKRRTIRSSRCPRRIFRRFAKLRPKARSSASSFLWSISARESGRVKAAALVCVGPDGAHNTRGCSSIYPKQKFLSREGLPQFRKQDLPRPRCIVGLQVGLKVA